MLGDVLEFKVNEALPASPGRQAEKGGPEPPSPRRPIFQLNLLGNANLCGQIARRGYSLLSMMRWMMVPYLAP